MNIAFNGLGMGLATLSRLSNAQTRSISAENFTGAKGQGGMATEGTGADAGRELGQGWKLSPSINIDGGSTVTLAEIDGPGAIQQIWLTVHPTFWRRLVIRFYWDDEETPSVEVPIGDFFCNGWAERCNITSLAVCVNPAGGFNCYWEMPFRQHARITVENICARPRARVLLPDQLHADRGAGGLRLFPCAVAAQQPAALPDRCTRCSTACRGRGSMSARTSPGASTTTAGGARARSSSSWMATASGRPSAAPAPKTTLAGRGTLSFPQGQYGVFSSPYSGLPQVIRPDGLYRSQQRFGLYRWHIMDPIRFQQDLRVTIQALGWRSQPEGKSRYLPMQDDIASTVFWYQTEPHAPFPPLPAANGLEVI